MKRILKKVAVVSMGAVLMIQMGVFPAVTSANEMIKTLPRFEEGTKAFADTPAITLEEAIQRVKANFEVPKEFSKFNSGYSSYDYRQVWSLNWNNNSEEGGGISAQVDAQTGDIISFNQWRPYKPDAVPAASTVTFDEAKGIATKLIEQLLSNRMTDLVFVEDDNKIIPVKNYGPVQFSFRWQRVLNQIPVIGDQVSIQINGDDGSISSYNLNWSKGDLQDVTGTISSEQAQKIFIETPMLELQYYLPGMIRPLASGEKRPVKLVYQLAKPNTGGAIDALTGEPLTLPRGHWAATTSGMLDGKGSVENAKAAEAPLTPEEQKEIEENEKYATQEEAIAVVKKLVGVPENLVLRNVSLNRDWQSDSRIWYLEWSSEKSEGEMREMPQYLHARVNALTKELWGFNRYIPNQDQSVGLERNEARKIAETFLTNIHPERFKQVKESKELQQVIIYDKQTPEGIQTGPIQFNYERYVNGIAFPSNSMYVVVDPVSKSVNEFNLYWGDYDFPTVSGVLSMDRATENYLKGRPLTLSYIKIYQDGNPETFKLVYIPFSNNGMPNSGIMDAKTGELLTWEGKPLSSEPQPYYFTDISGNKAEKEIEILGRAGAFGEFGSIFKPDQNVTLVSLLRASFIAQNGVWGYTNKTDDEIMKEAKDRGWLKEDYKADANVSREYLAKLMIRVLNLEQIAQLKGIFNAQFKDSSALSPEAVGYVALVDGLEIIDIDSRYFEPTHTVSRAEAALAIVRAQYTNFR